MAIFFRHLHASSLYALGQSFTRTAHLTFPFSLKIVYHQRNKFIFVEFFIGCIGTRGSVAIEWTSACQDFPAVSEESQAHIFVTLSLLIFFLWCQMFRLIYFDRRSALGKAPAEGSALAKFLEKHRAARRKRKYLS